jgi:hypothetical protein
VGQTQPDPPLSTERLAAKLGHLSEAEVERLIEGLLDIVGP